MKISARNRLEGTIVDLVKGAPPCMSALMWVAERRFFDIKPDRTLFTPLASPTPGDFQLEEP